MIDIYWCSQLKIACCPFLHVTEVSKKTCDVTKRISDDKVIPQHNKPLISSAEASVPLALQQYRCVQIRESLAFLHLEISRKVRSALLLSARCSKR